MTESIENILTEGYRTWRKNTVLGVPYLLSSAVTLVIVIAVVILLGAFIALPVMSLVGRGDLNLAHAMFPIFLLSIAVILVAALVVFVIGTFFSAGAIGMAKTATETTRTSLGDMMKYGEKKFLSLFFAHILIFLMVLIGSLVFVPAIVAFLLGLANIGMSLSILGLVVFILYLMVLSVVFLFVPYAVVIDDLGATEGIEQGYRVFMKNKLSAVFLWFTTMAIGMGLELVVGAITSFMSILPYIGAFINIGIGILYLVFLVMVIRPLTTVWWTRLYLDRTTGIKTVPIEPSLPETRPLNPEPPLQQPEIYM